MFALGLNRALLRWSPLSSSVMGAAIGTRAVIPMILSTAAGEEISPHNTAADF